MKNCNWLLLAICLVLANIAFGQNAADDARSGSAAAPATKPANTIGGGDLVEVSVFGAPEYKYDIRVASDGNIVLPLAGAVKVAGLSVDAAESAIARHLQESGTFNDPQVTVFQKEYATQGISVMGEVQKPGIYPLFGERRLLDAISAAGGRSASAGSVVSITHRDQPDAPELVTLSSDASHPSNNPPVLPGDTIVVSRAGVVYVVGDVREPSGIVMENPSLTVLQALAMAHGANSTAKLSQARIIRKNTGEPQQIAIRLDRMLAAKQPDQVLTAGDIIFVPSSAAKSATRRGLEAVIQAATGMAIYKPVP